MTQAADLLIGLAAGTVLGVAYLALLWRATARLPGAANPWRTALGSGSLRLALVVAGLWLVGAGAPVRLLAALAAFVVMRQVAVRRVRAQLTGTRGTAS